LLLKTQPASSRRKKSTADIECLDANDIYEEGFIEGPIDAGKVLYTFSFGMNAASRENNTETLPAPAEEKPFNTPGIPKQTYVPAPNGLTPPINGEHYTVKRSYAMRPSTVRKLNSLKAEHPDVNVLFNTIVDMAITHYYNYIFNDNGTFSFQEEKKINS
jgi:hypothetical protein